MKLTHRILKDATQFTGSQYFSNFFDICRNIFIRRILGPLTMGLFSELLIVQQYGKLHHLGILNAMDREIPFYRGKSEQGQVRLTESVSFTVSTLTALLAGTAIVLGSFLPVAKEFRRELWLIGLFIIIDSFMSYYRVLLRTNNEFGILSKVIIYGAIAETALTVGLAFLWGIKGLLLGMVLTSLAGTLYVVVRRPRFLKIPFNLDWKRLKSLFQIGVPLSLYSFIRTLFLSVDRILILVFLGRVYLGFYSIAIMVYNFATPLPKLISNVLYPRFMEAFGKAGDLDQVDAYLTKPTLTFAYLYPVAAGLGVLALPFFLHYGLPQFSPGLAAAQILLWGTCCYSLVFMWGYAMVALGRQWMVLWLNIVSTVVEIGLCVLLTGWLKFGLAGIAMGTALAHFFLSFLSISFIIWGHQKKKIECLRFLVRIHTPLAGAIVFVWLIGRSVPYSFDSLWLDFGIFLFQAVLFAAVWGSLMFHQLNQQIPILKVLKEWRASTVAIRSA